MEKVLQDYRWSHFRKLKELLNDDAVLVSPINAIRTVKLIELNNICELISITEADIDSDAIYEELKKHLRKNKTLIIFADVICPGVNTDALNMMMIRLLGNELTNNAKERLSSNLNVDNNPRSFK